jgi:RecG-like helicase
MSETMVTKIADAVWREPVCVEGRIRSLRVRPWGDNPTLEVVLVDDTGGITLVFLARRSIAGLKLGTHLRAEGTVGSLDNRPAILNPSYTIQPHQA